MDRTKRLLQTLVRLTQDIKKSNPLLLLALSLVPLCLVIWQLEEKNTQLQIWTQKIESLEQKSISSENSKAARQQLWSQVKRSNPQYFSQTIEALLLLTPELNR